MLLIYLKTPSKEERPAFSPLLILFFQKITSSESLKLEIAWTRVKLHHSYSVRLTVLTIKSFQNNFKISIFVSKCKQIATGYTQCISIALWVFYAICLQTERICIQLIWINQPNTTFNVK